MTTCLAPASMWPLALSLVRNRPVDSMTYSAPISFQGRLAGSRSANTGMERPSTMMAFSLEDTWASILPCMVSYFSI